MNAFLSTVRFVALTVLTFLRPLVVAAGALVGSIALLGFLACLILSCGGEEGSPAGWAFLVVGISATALVWLFDLLLGWLAPDGQVMTTER